MRDLSAGRKSLDDVMRRLWRDFVEHDRGVASDRIQRLVCELAGEDLGSFLDGLIYGTGDLPLDGLLEVAGIDVTRRAASNLQDKGGKEVSDELPRVDFGAMLKAGQSGIAIQRVSEAGSAQIAGLAAGDEIIAVDGIRLDLGKLEKKMQRAQPGDRWWVHAFRRDELHLVEIVLQPAVEDSFVLKLKDPPTDQSRAWLNL
jgi:predicted metalloprotease with PDZ domain